MKVALIVGTRPEFIQVEPVLKELVKRNNIPLLVHTGQHYDYEMSRVFFEELNIPEPDYHLGVGSGTHGYQTGEMLKKLEGVLLKEKPDFVLVFGDTNSTLAGALASVKLHIPVAHVEAGLRSFDRRMPEEINRILVDHISDILFAPTKTAVNNLNKEGIFNHVYNVGDVMCDSLLQNMDVLKRNISILNGLGLSRKSYLLMTVHRAENTEDVKNLRNILYAVIESEEQIIFPAHPRTVKQMKVYSLYSMVKRSNVKIINPVSYLNFLRLLDNAKKVLTDSGGVQKQAYLLKTPCITLRENTEWIETVKDGWNVLVGADKEKIVKMINEFEPKGKQRNVFGDGKASENIINLLDAFLDNEEKSKLSEEI